MAKKMKKRIFAGLLALVMMAALLPTMAFASTNELTRLNVTINIPLRGEVLDYSPQVKDIDPEGSASIVGVTWYKILKDDYGYESGAQNDWILIEDNNEVAGEGYLYKSIIEMKLADDYNVAQNANVSFNKVPLSVDYNADNAYWIGEGNSFYLSSFFLATPQIMEFEATIDVPQLGEALDYTPDAEIDPEGSASIVGATWYKILRDDYDYKPGAQNDWELVGENEVAEKGYLYRIIIEAKATENYIVSNNASVAINEVGLQRDGNLDNKYWIDHNYFYLSDYYLPKSIDLTSFEATINTPKVGEKLDYVPNVSADPQNGANVEDVKWYKILKTDYDDSPDAINNWVMMDKDEVAQKGYLYGVVIKAPLSAECVAAENMTVKLNNMVLPESLTGGTNMYYVDDDVLFMFYDFEPAAETPTPEPTKPATPTPEVTNSATATGVKGAKTGDANDMSMWIALLASGVTIGALVAAKRKYSGK